MALPAPIDWAAIETAAVEWFTRVTGLDTVWSGAEHPERYPYAVLSINGPKRDGGHDELRYSTDLTRPEGQEVGIEAVGWRQITLSCEVFVGPDESHDPSRNARHFLSIAKSSLSLPSAVEKLRSAGLAYISDEGIENLDEKQRGRWLSHGRIEIRFRLASSLEERTGFIEKVAISSKGLGEVDFNDEIFGGKS